MIPEITWGEYISEKEKRYTKIELVYLNSLKSQNYGKTKLTTLQKFIHTHEVEIYDGARVKKKLVKSK